MKLRQLALTLCASAAVLSAGVLTPEPVRAAVDLSVQLSAYLPAPPGVTIRFEAGRPYYIENNRRVYMKKKDKGDRGKHLGHEKGRKKGHGRD